MLGWNVLVVVGAQKDTVIEQWGQFEISLKGPSTGNPFMDVHLASTFVLEQDEAMDEAMGEASLEPLVAFDFSRAVIEDGNGSVPNIGTSSSR